MFHHPSGELQLHRDIGAVGAGGRGRGLCAGGGVMGLLGSALCLRPHHGQQAEQQPQQQGHPHGMQRHGGSLVDPHR